MTILAARLEFSRPGGVSVMQRGINRWFFVAGVGLVLAGASAHARDRSKDPVPRNIVSWFSDDDYPATAKRAGESGAVQFEVSVSADGKPVSCRIVASSNSKVLDDQTCALVMKRGQFDPALDRKGKPVQGKLVRRTRWVLDDTAPTPIGRSYRAAGELRIDNQGRLLSCVDAPTVGEGRGDADSVCDNVKDFPDAAMLMLRGGAEGPIEVPVIFENSMVPDGEAAPTMTYLAAGRQRIAVEIVHFEIDDQGKAINCRTVEKAVWPFDLCTDGLLGPYALRPGNPRGVTVTLAVSRQGAGA